MHMIRSNGGLNEEHIKTLEQYLGINFPKDYRTFIQKHNGGEPEKSVFLFNDENENGSIVDRLFGFVPNKFENFLVYLRDYQSRIPPNMFPIGYDPGGNLILISVKMQDRGKIYFWDHEQEADPAQGETPDYSNLTHIADSFDEFINGLRSIESN